MKAAVLHEAKTPLQVEEVVVSKPAAREVLIRTHAVGVCRSDLHFVDGAWPHPVPTVPGHEAAGVVEALIVVDRYCWLREQEGVERAWVQTVFEYGLSPRNLVVVGVKGEGKGE